jgi:hypothetical protein
MTPSQATFHAEIGPVIARLLRAEGVAERYQDPSDRWAKMLQMTALGEGVASENIPSRARTGRNCPRCSLRHAPRVKACLLGVNCRQTAGIA